MIRIIAALLALFVALAPIPVLAQGSAQPFKLLFIGALSGPVGPIGRLELAGYRAAAEDVNAHGGILGRRIEVTSEDSQGQGAKAASILQEKLNAGPKPDAVVAGAISNETRYANANMLVTVLAGGWSAVIGEATVIQCKLYRRVKQGVRPA